MTRKSCYLILSLALVFAVGSATSAEEHAIHWGYFGDTGPQYWGDLSPEFSTCKTGKAQSPINLGRGAYAKLPPLQLHYRASTLELVNNGHTVQVNVEPGSWLRLGNKRYELKQFHFHTPSEHQIYTRPLPMEVHFVHKSRDGELAVIAALARFGYRPHPALRRIWDYLPMSSGETSDSGGMRLNPITLFPMKHTYQTYEGSLTTPPCTERVRWIVLKEPLRISADQAAKFTQAVGENARPVQPLNGREVEAFR